MALDNVWEGTRTQLTSGGSMPTLPVGGRGPPMPRWRPHRTARAAAAASCNPQHVHVPHHLRSLYHCTCYEGYQPRNWRSNASSILPWVHTANIWQRRRAACAPTPPNHCATMHNPQHLGLVQHCTCGGGGGQRSSQQCQLLPALEGHFRYLTHASSQLAPGSTAPACSTCDSRACATCAALYMCWGCRPEKLAHQNSLCGPLGATFRYLTACTCAR